MPASTPAAPRWSTNYKVDADNLAFDDVIIAAYLTFMEQPDSADIHLVA